MLINTKLMKNNFTFDKMPQINPGSVEEHNPKSPPVISPVIIPWDREKLLAKNCTQSQELRDALREVVRARWTTPYDRTGGQIRDAFLAVLGIMYFPNVYLASKSDPATPHAQKVMKLKLQASADTIRTTHTALAATLWTAYNNAVLDMLNRTYFWAETDPDNGLIHGGLGSRRKGYITDRIQHPTATPPAVATPVRGIAMSIREFDNDPTLAPTLAASFTKDALKTIHDNVPGLGMYREHCVNCRSQLPLFDVTVGAANYNLNATGALYGLEYLNSKNTNYRFL
ncbi:hypothetical protein LX32DRAFT_650640 [Colletotrichum zoysiae]|uniref:Uncharacterized protein n=1 Tax=Colletotrichum zoysiae TaxID=1216348 RepID=A0AAD9M3A6_9PEZI|nr:hypothetical protein LX32DRAFT_650640 [Colletotrichum zoysiae]